MKRSIRVATKPIQTRMMIPGSKSITNRALLMAALAEGVSEVTQILISDDTIAFIEALRQLGVMVQLDKATQSCIVLGCSGRFPKLDASIQCKNAGTVARFLLAACAASPGKYSFDASLQLQNRPLAELLRVLCAQGAKIEPPNATQMPLTIYGDDGLQGGNIAIDGSLCGQFVSALLMAAPFSKTSTLIEVRNLVSRPFVNMTCAMMSEFGVLVRRLHQERFSIPAPQRYIARDYIVEPDITTAGYFLQPQP